MPDDRIVVLSCVVVLTGAGAFLTVVDVVVVVGVGFSTTVVHEVNSAVATARSGVTIISFFIVGVVSFMDRSSQVVLPDVFLAKISKLISRWVDRALRRAMLRNAGGAADFEHRAAERPIHLSHPRCSAISLTSISGVLIRECASSGLAGEANAGAGFFRAG